MKGDLKITTRFNDGDYLSKNQNWHVEDSPWKAEQIDKILQRNSLSPKTICEVGCGAGEIIKQLSIKPQYSEVNFTGYEISDDAFELCRSRSAERLQFLKQDLLDVGESYNVVLCIDVFEHVENYMGFLRSLKHRGEFKVFHIPLDLTVSSLMRGRLMHGRDSVGHLHYFTPDTALATLTDCGYHIIDKLYTPSFSGLPSKNWKAMLVKLPRLAVFKLSPKILSTYLGGVSLMVLAK